MLQCCEGATKISDRSGKSLEIGKKKLVVFNSPVLQIKGQNILLLLVQNS